MRLGGVTDRHHGMAGAGLGGGVYCREHPGDGPHRAVEPELTQVHDVAHDLL